jgi:3-oxoacyl-[acyl-carrier protein] reductase
VTARSGEGPIGSLTVRADVTDSEQVDSAFSAVEAELGPVEVVVANAGITRDTLLLRMSDDDFDTVVDTNLGGAFRVVKRASKGMLKARFGRVILISSVVGRTAHPGRSTTRRRRRDSSESRVPSPANWAPAASRRTSWRRDSSPRT